MSSAREIQSLVRAKANAEIAAHSQRFFKTGTDGYGAGDRFLGIRVPELRRIARRFKDASLPVVVRLLRSRWHEERLLALILLVEQFKRADSELRSRIYRTYTDHLHFINNWDLVDGSAPQIVGGSLQNQDRKPLYSWAVSESLWERRITIMATFHFIRQRDFADALAISELLLRAPEDLIHKAVGWMLREIGNRDRSAEEAFLEKHATIMPRTMLRYAIEKFPETRRKFWLTRPRTNQ